MGYSNSNFRYKGAGIQQRITSKSHIINNRIEINRPMDSWTISLIIISL